MIVIISVDFLIAVVDELNMLETLSLNDRKAFETNFQQIIDNDDIKNLREQCTQGEFLPLLDTLLKTLLSPASQKTDHLRKQIQENLMLYYPHQYSDPFKKNEFAYAYNVMLDVLNKYQIHHQAHFAPDPCVVIPIKNFTTAFSNEQDLINKLIMDCKQYNQCQEIIDTFSEILLGQQASKVEQLKLKELDVYRKEPLIWSEDMVLYYPHFYEKNAFEQAYQIILNVLSQHNISYKEDFEEFHMVPYARISSDDFHTAYNKNKNLIAELINEIKVRGSQSKTLITEENVPFTTLDNYLISLSKRNDNDLNLYVVILKCCLAVQQQHDMNRVGGIASSKILLIKKEDSINVKLNNQALMKHLTQNQIANLNQKELACSKDTLDLAKIFIPHIKEDDLSYHFLCKMTYPEVNRPTLKEAIIFFSLRLKLVPENLKNKIINDAISTEFNIQNDKNNASQYFADCQANLQSLPNHPLSAFISDDEFKQIVSFLKENPIQHLELPKRFDKKEYSIPRTMHYLSDLNNDEIYIIETKQKEPGGKNKKSTEIYQGTTKRGKVSWRIGKSSPQPWISMVVTAKSASDFNSVYEQAKKETDISQWLASQLCSLTPHPIHYTLLGEGYVKKDENSRITSYNITHYSPKLIGDLKTFLDQNLLFKNMDPRLKTRTEARIRLSILNSIKLMHEHGIIHQDIKPKNFLVGQGKRGYYVKITDFGSAVFYTEKRLAEAAHAYESPEIAYIFYDYKNTLDLPSFDYFNMHKKDDGNYFQSFGRQCALPFYHNLSRENYRYAHPSNDMWAVGALFFYMHTGKPLEANMEVEVDQQSLSIKRLLHPRRDQRPTIQEALFPEKDIGKPLTFSFNTLPKLFTNSVATNSVSVAPKSATSKIIDNFKKLKIKFK